MELHSRLTPAPYQGTSNVEQMKKMASRGNDKKFFASKANKFERGEWLDNQDVCQMHQSENFADAS